MVGFSTMVFGVLICVSPTRMIFFTVVLSESTFITIGLYLTGCVPIVNALLEEFGDDLTIVLFTISSLLPGKNDVCLNTGCVVVVAVIIFELPLATVRSLLFTVVIGLELGVDTSTLVYFNGGIERSEPDDVVTAFTCPERFSITILLSVGVDMVDVLMELPALTIIRLLCEGDITIDEVDGDAIVTGSGLVSFSCMLPSLSANNIGMSKMSAVDISDSSLFAAGVVLIILLICPPDRLDVGLTMVNLVGFSAIDVFACGGFICTEDNICGPELDVIFIGVSDVVLN